MIYFFLLLHNQHRFLQENNSTTSTDENTNLHDFIVFIVVSFFSIFFTICASLLAYYNWRENKLMKDYIHNGAVVDGIILDKEYLRIIPTTKRRDRIETEFSALCEYEQQQQPVDEDHNSIIRVRKQIRIRDNDLLYKPISLSKVMRTQVVLDRKKLGNQVCVVHLFVLPGLPLSGYPCKAAERATTMRYQLSTTFLVVALFCVSLFCVIIFAGFIGDMIQWDKTQSTWFGIGFILILIIFELTIIHGCCKSKIDLALHHEYKVSGEYEYPYEQ